MWIAAAELWIAARTDNELREALIAAERTIAERIRSLVKKDEMFTGIPETRVVGMVGVLYASMRGIMMHEAFDPSRSRADRQKTELVRALRAWLQEARPGAPMNGRRTQL